MSPVGPDPKMRTSEPGLRLSMSAPCRAHAVGSARPAVAMSSPWVTNVLLARTTTYSAKPPGALQPSETKFSQNSARPVRQGPHSPQWIALSTATVEPNGGKVTPSPCSTTRPRIS